MPPVHDAILHYATSAWCNLALWHHAWL